MNNIKTFENFNNQDIFKYILNNDIKSVKNYINSGYDLNIRNKYSNTALIVAVFYNRIKIIELLLNAGADINKQDNNGNTALIKAVYHNKIKIVKLLLNAGADIDKQNIVGITALILAASYNNRAIVEILLDYYADEFILNYENESFYDYLNDVNKKHFMQKYPTSVYNAISHNYKKSFTEFIKDYNIKIIKLI